MITFTIVASILLNIVMISISCINVLQASETSQLKMKLIALMNHQDLKYMEMAAIASEPLWESQNLSKITEYIEIEQNKTLNSVFE